MIDFHSHILPKMDDGSKSSDMSCAMLRELEAQGADTVVATSHFYAYENSPSEYLTRRQHSFEALRKKWEKETPEIRLGAEVQYFEGISHADGLTSLCIEGTNLLLVEMPFLPWSDRTVNDIIRLNARTDLQILLAHINRYPEHKNTALMQHLRSAGIAMQVNAEAFLSFRTRREALNLLKNGIMDVIGTDCHNMTDRAPNLKPALEVIEHKLGSACVRELEQRSKSLLGL